MVTGWSLWGEEDIVQGGGDRQALEEEETERQGRVKGAGR